MSRYNPDTGKPDVKEDEKGHLQEVYVEHPTQEFLAANKEKIKGDVNIMIKDNFTALACIVLKSDFNKENTNTQVISTVTSEIDRFYLVQGLLKLIRQLMDARKE